MGKQHFSGDKPKRRGPASSGAGRGTTGRSYNGSRDGSRDDRGREGSAGSGRPPHGNGRFQERSDRGAPSREGSFRPGAGRNGDARRPAGSERFARREDTASNYSKNDYREERPRADRPSYPPKAIWPGQPVRYEGKPTVPRGTPGERNRKFVKQDPSAPAPPRAAYPASNSDERFPRREEARYGERRGYPKREERPTPARAATRPAERGFGGEVRAPRAGGAAYAPRSYGERPATGGTFRERREALRQAEGGGARRNTGYGRASGPQLVGSARPDEAPDYRNLKHYEADKTRGNKRRREEADFGTEAMRLNRYIANAGICSRREADALIAAGEIRVNGEVVTEMGYKVQPTDTVQYGKTNLAREKQVYVLLNKPKDFITTTDDPEGRKTVMDLVANASKERIFPVGRLDRNTTGLLLFTNDGEVAQKLSHPSHKNKKIYQVELDKPLSPEHLRQIAEGVELEDGKAEVDDVAVVAGNPHFVGVELHIGRNRVVRRIFEHLGYDVVSLDRVQYAGLTKKDLPRGKWRFLTEQEVIRLKYFL